MLSWAAKLTPLQLIELARKGIHGSQLREIQREAGFSNHEWAYYLRVAERTIQRYGDSNTRVDPAVSERALLLAQIAELGRDVFGTEEKFKLWLSVSSVALGGVSPHDLLDTTTGMELVRTELLRIEHGIF